MGKCLPYISFAYREEPVESTGLGSFELIFGCNIRGPLDVLKEQWSSAEETVDDVLTYVNRVLERMKAARAILIQNMMETQKNQKE